MRQSLLKFAAFAAVTTLSGAAFAYDEGVGGDLSTSGATPTAISFTSGTNSVKGTLNVGGTDNRDYFTFTVPAGQRLTAIRQLKWLNAVDATGGNRGYHAIRLGNTAQDPSPSSAPSYLGGDHVDASATVIDLLPALADGLSSGTPSGSGFPGGSLGPGTYAHVIQQTGSNQISYEFEFVLSASVPGVGPGMLVALTGLLGLAGLFVAACRGRMTA